MGREDSNMKKNDGNSDEYGDVDELRVGPQIFGLPSVPHRWNGQSVERFSWIPRSGYFNQQVRDALEFI